MSKVFTVGEKVYYGGSSGFAYTIELISGDHAVIRGYSDNKLIVKLTNLTSVVYVQSEGWYTFDNLPDMAYYVTFDAYTKDPKLVWAFDFITQKLDLSPHPQGFNPLTVFAGYEFKPVKLTTQRI
jgi:hypothetical protein